MTEIIKDAISTIATVGKAVLDAVSLDPNFPPVYYFRHKPTARAPVARGKFDTLLTTDGVLRDVIVHDLFLPSEVVDGLSPALYDAATDSLRIAPGQQFAASLGISFRMYDYHSMKLCESEKYAVFDAESRCGIKGYKASVCRGQGWLSGRAAMEPQAVTLRNTTADETVVIHPRTEPIARVAIVNDFSRGRWQCLPDVAETSGKLAEYTGPEHLWDQCAAELDF